VSKFLTTSSAKALASWLAWLQAQASQRHDLFKKFNRSINIKPQLLEGLAMDDFMEVQELRIFPLLGSQKVD